MKQITASKSQKSQSAIRIKGWRENKGKITGGIMKYGYWLLIVNCSVGW